ncbi:MAG: flagellar protein FlgN [Thermodesulfovibrio sp.]|uniref:flagellar protein FlgN n=1 Tax=unclassified Thermodesulfovibrio TaxID=2645936 RepID=UPI000855AC10|nr:MULTISPECIES: flagellar protein FlgN [unclassified Thermodesulfovibrio]MDI1471788.1 flagellar protein FlgN [Thermodesulfovibrio sp. 1176]MDI6713678.1 flagellar protein FlgN [Thermodesulfovibrio sp.]ODA44178.1 Flagellar protein FlgN [Thermodesulfovibrio sp. N1]
MTSLYDELVKVLQNEKNLLSSLYKIVSEERDAIVALQAKELERILREKEAVLMKLSLWESERERILEKNNLYGKSFSEIISHIEQTQDVQRLRELYSAMKTLLTAIAEIQKINEQLIDRSIINIGTAIKFLESFGITPKQSLSKEA